MLYDQGDEQGAQDRFEQGGRPSLARRQPRPPPRPGRAPPTSTFWKGRSWVRHACDAGIHRAVAGPGGGTQASGQSRWPVWADRSSHAGWRVAIHCGGGPATRKRPDLLELAGMDVNQKRRAVCATPPSKQTSMMRGQQHGNCPKSTIFRYLSAHQGWRGPLLL